MALNPATLATSWASALGITDATAQASFLTLATQLIAHIQANAVVTVMNTVPGTGLVAPAGGGPVTGAVVGSTGTGTIA